MSYIEFKNIVKEYKSNGVPIRALMMHVLLLKR